MCTNTGSESIASPLGTLGIAVSAEQAEALKRGEEVTIDKAALPTGGIRLYCWGQRPRCCLYYKPPFGLQIKCTY